MTQKQALSVMLEGASVFLTGPPGAGKTFVLREFIRRAGRRGKSVAVTASTGIAATHIGGTTIHSWSGLGVRDRLSPHDLQWLSENDRLRKRYQNTDVLVIDEVSMLHGARLDMVNQVCKLLRESDAPFGGLQVILVGDLFQLPPVSPGEQVFDFVHHAAAWTELSPQICYLSEQHRVAEDGLLSLLEALRQGDLQTEHHELLESRIGQRPPEGLPVTRLYTHNIDVETINQRHLDALTSSSKTFNMTGRGNKNRVEQLKKGLLAPEELTLKPRAEVMFVANNFQAGYVNGSLGQVLDFQDGLPLVRLVGGRTLKVEPYTWTLEEDGKVRAEVSQLPLRLAWAITVHKSQGMSLDAAEMDLSKSFTPGMGYVALSRVRSLEGVYLMGINPQALQLHPDIYEFDRQLRQASEILAFRTAEIGDEPESPEAPEKPEQPADQPLFDALRRWRIQRSKADHVAPFIIAHDSLLKSLSVRKPTVPGRLVTVKGMGPAKVEKYGNDILEVINRYIAQHPEAAEQQEQRTKQTDEALLQALQSGATLAETAERLQLQPDEIWQRLGTLLQNEPEA